MKKKQLENRKLKQGKKTTIDNRKKYRELSLGFISSAFFILITAIFPLYVKRTGYFFITQDKANFFITSTNITAILIIIALLITTERFWPLNQFFGDMFKRRITIAEGAIIAFLLLTLASAIFSPWQDFVWRGFTTNGTQGRWEGFWAFFAYVLAFLIIARFYRPRRLHFLIFACSAILLTLNGILEYVGFDFLERTGFFQMGNLEFHPITRSFRTTLGNINIVSAYCSLVIVLFAVLFTGENSRWGILYFIPSVFAFLLLSICMGDSGRVGMLGAMVLIIPYWFSDRLRFGKMLILMAGWCAVFAANQLYIVYVRPNRIPFHPNLFITLAIVLLAAGFCVLLFIKKWPGRQLKIAGAAFLGVALIGGLLFIEIAGSRWSNQPRNIVWQAREIMHGRMGDNFGSGRGWVWKNGISVIKYNPLLGTGPDTFYFAMGGTQTGSVEEARRNPHGNQNIVAAGGLHYDSFMATRQIFDKAHNTFLQIAVCLGLPALLAYLIFLGALFIPAVKIAFRRPVLLAFGAGSLSYLIQCFFQVDTPIDRPLIYIALGVMAVELWQAKIEAKAETKVEA
jgi:hypothetical protein